MVWTIDLSLKLTTMKRTLKYKSIKRCIVSVKEQRKIIRVDPPRATLRRNGTEPLLMSCKYPPSTRFTLSTLLWHSVSIENFPLIKLVIFFPNYLHLFFHFTSYCLRKWHQFNSKMASNSNQAVYPTFSPDSLAQHHLPQPQVQMKSSSIPLLTPWKICHLMRTLLK